MTLLNNELPNERTNQTNAWQQKSEN